MQAFVLVKRDQRALLSGTFLIMQFQHWIDTHLATHMLVHFVLSIYNANFNLNVTSVEAERRLSIALAWQHSFSLFLFLFISFHSRNVNVNKFDYFNIDIHSEYFIFRSTKERKVQSRRVLISLSFLFMYVAILQGEGWLTNSALTHSFSARNRRLIQIQRTSSGRNVTIALNLFKSRCRFGLSDFSFSEQCRKNGRRADCGVYYHNRSRYT